MKKVVVGLLLVSVLLVGCQFRPMVPDRPSRIVFMTDRDGNFELYIAERNGRNPQKITDDPNVNNGLPNWTEKADALAFVSDQGSGQLAMQRINLDGTEKGSLAGGPAPDVSPPIWSPEADWIAFSSAVDETNVDVFVMSVTDGEVINITEHPGLDQFQTWSPDGTQVLFASDRDGGLTLYTVGVEGGEATRLTAIDSANGEPSWSPDGSKIAFMSNRDEDIEVYVMEADGSNPTRLTESQGFDGYPRWSPDGSKIAFLSGRDDNAEIYVMNADGSNPTNLTNSPSRQESVQGSFAWSPDGRQILFHVNENENMDVFVMDADGSNVVNVTENPNTDFGAIWVR